MNIDQPEMNEKVNVVVKRRSTNQQGLVGATMEVTRAGLGQGGSAAERGANEDDGGDDSYKKAGYTTARPTRSVTLRRKSRQEEDEETKKLLKNLSGATRCVVNL